jgi:hypothetical protein
MRMISVKESFDCSRKQGRQDTEHDGRGKTGNEDEEEGKHDRTGQDE